MPRAFVEDVATELSKFGTPEVLHPNAAWAFTHARRAILTPVLRKKSRRDRRKPVLVMNTAENSSGNVVMAMWKLAASRVVMVIADGSGIPRPRLAWGRPWL